jgi:hypothetical protein
LDDGVSTRIKDTHGFVFARRSHHGSIVTPLHILQGLSVARNGLFLITSGNVPKFDGVIGRTGGKDCRIVFFFFILIFCCCWNVVVKERTAEEAGTGKNRINREAKK